MRLKQRRKRRRTSEFYSSIGWLWLAYLTQCWWRLWLLLLSLWIILDRFGGSVYVCIAAACVRTPTHEHVQAVCLCALLCTAAHCRLLRALQDSKRAVAKITKEKHAADVAAAELRGKAEAERDTQRMEVQMAQQQLEAARAQVVRLEGEIKDYKARAQVGNVVLVCTLVAHVPVGTAAAGGGMGSSGAAGTGHKDYQRRHASACSWPAMLATLPIFIWHSRVRLPLHANCCRMLTFQLCCLCRIMQTLLRAKDAEIAAARDAAAASINSSSSTVALKAEVTQLKQLLETTAEAAQQQLRQQQSQHQQAQQSLEAEVSQAKSSAGYYQQLAQETATSLEEVKQSLAAAEEALKEAREELKSAAAAQRARQRGQLSVLKEDELAASAATGVTAAAGGASANELAALQQQKQQLTEQVEQLQLKLAQVQVRAYTFLEPCLLAPDVGFG